MSFHAIEFKYFPDVRRGGFPFFALPVFSQKLLDQLRSAEDLKALNREFRSVFVNDAVSIDCDNERKRLYWVG